MFSNISDRLTTMRERERETERNRVQQRTNMARTDRVLLDLNRWRQVAAGRVAAFPSAREGPGADLEAQTGATGTEAPVNDSFARRGTSSAGKTRREREEGAALFGPNLANYFGSGSSSSGAVMSTPGVDNSNNITSFGSQRRSRLGSRGRARGASLSGLNNLSLLDDLAGASALSLPDQSGAAVGASTEPLSMAEGIELDTLKRWIDRSVVGGAIEIPGMDSAPASSGDAGNPPTLCSTLQSYVNLKRNTIKLNIAAEEDVTSPVAAQTPTLRSVTSFGQSILGAAPLTPTHLMQFEYDCAAPNASIQVFVRASRKHGSWVTWSTAREAAGLSSEQIPEADDEADAQCFAQRGPPPHVLGWPVYVNRLKKGFGKPLKAAISLRLELYAPPKVDQADKKVEQSKSERDEQVPETPALDAAKRLGEETEPTPLAAPQAVQDPLTRFNAHSVAETKEAKAAREKAERETLKVAIVVEALDEDGKPLGEPNLQTTYLRLASLPLRQQPSMTPTVDGGNVIEEGQDSGPVQDIAMPGDEASVAPRRVWSLQVEGQEAEIGPHRFQLQELYGLSSRPPPAQQEHHHDQDPTEGVDADGEAIVPDSAMVDYARVQESGATECLICLSSPPTTLLLPCTHGLCLECAVQLRESVKAVRETERRRGRRPKRKYACPVCRRGEWAAQCTGVSNWHTHCLAFPHSIHEYASPQYGRREEPRPGCCSRLSALCRYPRPRHICLPCMYLPAIPLPLLSRTALLAKGTCHSQTSYILL